MEKWKRHWHAIPFELDWKIFHSKQCSLLHAEHFSWLQSRCYASNMFFMSEAEDIKPNTKTESKLLLSFMCRFASFYFLFLDELQQVFFCGTSYSIETLMRIPLKPRKKISSVWIFLKVEESSGLLGSLEIINIDGASPSNQPLWGQFMQKEGQYLNLGKVTIKPRGIFIHSWKGRNLSKKKTYFSLKRTYFILNLV